MPVAAIKFYGRNDEFGCFSNFTHAPFRLNGQTWPTVEHFFGAQRKCRHGIRGSDPAGEVACQGGKRSAVREVPSAAQTGKPSRTA